MNFGIITRQALQRATLPADIEYLELARSYANDNIQMLWYLTKPDFRQSRDTITIVSGANEYVLNKLFDSFVPNTLRGPSDNPRILTYKDPIDFFYYTKSYEDSTGTPVIYSFGDFMGVDKQPPLSTQIQVYSSLANKTTGTVTVTNGSQRIIGVGTSFSLNDVGLRFKKDGDNKTYKISKFISLSELEIDEVYRGISSSASNYKVGDVGVHVSVQGFVGGEIDSEDLELDGETVVQTSKSFATLTSVTKSDLTGGRIIARNTANTVNVAILAPGEYEVERQTVVLWRIPDSAETLSYRFYMKHPVLRLETDRCLIPVKYHPLISKMTEADLREFSGMEVPSKLAGDLKEGRFQFERDADNTDLWQTIPGGGPNFYQPESANWVIDPDFI